LGNNYLKKLLLQKRTILLANSILMAFAVMENNFEETKRYSYNLLSADYNSYIESMAPAANSNLPMIRNYMDRIIEMYQGIAKFFLENGDRINWKKAMNIVENIKSIKNKKH